MELFQLFLCSSQNTITVNKLDIYIGTYGLPAENLQIERALAFQHILVIYQAT